MTVHVGSWVAALCMMAVITACTSSTHPDRAVRTSTAPSAPTPRSPSDARYVSVSGDDDGPGTEDQPWRTLSASLPKLSAGQVLYVHGGSYREALTRPDLQHGRPGRPIGVTNVPGEVPTILGTVVLQRPDHWMINGLNVTSDDRLAHQPRFLVQVTGGVAWHWTNSEIGGSPGTANLYVKGFGTFEPRGWSLTGDCFHATGDGGAGPTSNLMLGGMARPGRGMIKRNVLLARGSAVNLAIGSASAAPREVRIRYNTVYGGRLAIALRSGPRDVSIARNLLGGASADVLVQSDLQVSPGTLLSQNYAITSREGAPGATRLARRQVEATIGGVGNVVSDQNPHFPDPRSCDGFQSRTAALAPYGRYGL